MPISKPIPSPRHLPLVVVVTVVVIATVAVLPHAARAEVGVNLFGLSHHLNDDPNERLREFNPGAGLSWTFARDGRGSLDANVGVYTDSYGHANWHLSLGGRVRLASPLSLGLQLINAASPSLFDGYPVVTPYPFLSARFDRAALNLTYLPEIGSFNGLATVATFVTVYPWSVDAGHVGAPRPAGAGSALEFTVPRLGNIAGLDGGGFIWRHMFDDRRGLRLGARLGGEITRHVQGDQVSSPDGSYGTTLLLQYLGRGQPRGRLRPYWASGLEVRFAAYNGGADVAESWRTDVGVEYELNPAVALALEYSGAVTYSRQSYDHWDGEDERSWSFDGSDVRLAVVARRADLAAAASPGAGGSGLLVQLGQDLTTEPFSGAAIAWRRLDVTGRGWRLALQPTLQRKDPSYYDSEEYGVAVRAERLSRRAGPDGVATYWGLGPVAGFTYRSNDYTSYEDDTVSKDIVREFSVGITALAGAEFPVTEGIYLLAEYSSDLRWVRIARHADSHMTRWQVVSNGARLGLGTHF